MAQNLLINAAASLYVVNNALPWFGSVLGLIINPFFVLVPILPQPVTLEGVSLATEGVQLAISLHDKQYCSCG